jgi:hypothetical protein
MPFCTERGRPFEMLYPRVKRTTRQLHVNGMTLLSVRPDKGLY